MQPDTKPWLTHTEPQQVQKRRRSGGSTGGASSGGRHLGSVARVGSDQRLLAGSQLLLQAGETLLHEQ